MYLFVVSVVVDTASLLTGIGTDTENKGKPGIIIRFFTDCVIINLLQWIFHCEKVETNSNYLKRSILKHTPTQNDVASIQSNLSCSIRKCQANCGQKTDPGNLK